MNLSALTTDRKPSGLIVVPVSAFADTWDMRPGEPTCIGLRLLSEQDIVFARGEAAKLAAEMVDEESRWETFNDALMRYVVARSACDPNNARENWFVGGEDVAFVALTPEGTRTIFDAYERLRVERSPVQPEASVEEIEGLFPLVQLAMPLMAPARAARVRRLLGFCMTEMREAVPADG